jgi:glycosyltransferase involved in cell wall biosynthesis
VEEIIMSNISVIVTVLNEEKTIVQLLESLSQQTLSVREIIIVDGGSVDETLVQMKEFAKTHPKLNLRIIQKKGNRSIGRNAAIKKAKSELIAITDAGCVPHLNWLEELDKAAQKIDQKDFVVAGYYDAKPNSPFEEALVPYVLVMPDRVNPRHFLPATRSMLMTKSAWKKVGGFDEKLSDNEDYAFAHALEKASIFMSFAPKAKVSWIPRSNLLQFWKMIFRFARGDAQARIWRPKVLFLFARYISALTGILLWLALGLQLKILFFFYVVFFGFYLLWSIQKNLRYVPHGWYWLPLLQLTADGAVMLGTLNGLR